MTVDEMQTFFKELAEKDNDNHALSDEELDQVAGGKCIGWVVYFHR